MKQLWAVTCREWKIFIGGGFAALAIYGFITVVYSLLFMFQGQGEQQTVWWLFFSLVTAGASSMHVFTVERMSGAFEVILTAGIARSNVLLGKIVFVITSALCMGVLPAIAAICIRPNLDIPGIALVDTPVTGMLLFCMSVVLVAGCSSFFSLALTNPRLSYFFTMFAIGGVAAVYFVSQFNVVLTLVVVALIALGMILLALRMVESEKVIQPPAL